MCFLFYMVIFQTSRILHNWFKQLTHLVIVIHISTNLLFSQLFLINVIFVKCSCCMSSNVLVLMFVFTIGFSLYCSLPNCLSILMAKQLDTSIVVEEWGREILSILFCPVWRKKSLVEVWKLLCLQAIYPWWMPAYILKSQVIACMIYFFIWQICMYDDVLIFCKGNSLKIMGSILAK